MNDHLKRSKNFLLKASVIPHLSAEINFVRLTILAALQLYLVPAAFKLNLFGVLTVLLEVPASPTLTWKELTALAGSCAKELITPPLQQFAICWL